jgi:hypothetical protein
VTSLQHNVGLNMSLFDTNTTRVEAQTLKWDRHSVYDTKFDVIIVADWYHHHPHLLHVAHCYHVCHFSRHNQCLYHSVGYDNSLFFRDYHIDLLHVLMSSLAVNGRAIIIGPRRGATLSTFMTLATTASISDHSSDTAAATATTTAANGIAATGSGSGHSTGLQLTLSEPHEYDTMVNDRHIAIMKAQATQPINEQLYDTDIHQPLLLMGTLEPSSPSLPISTQSTSTNTVTIASVAVT